jgi:two-component system NtrC family sensor kinase
MRGLGSRSSLWLRLALGMLGVVACGAIASGLIGAAVGPSVGLIPALLAVMAVVVSATLAFLYLTTRRLSRILNHLAETAEAVARGDLGRDVDVTSCDEAGRLATAFKTMLARLRARAQYLEEEDHKRVEELMQLQSRMAHSEKLASMGRLAAGVAHELNTPLGGVLSLTMLALEECTADHPLRKDLEVIVEQALHCREIVKGLLTFAHQSESRAAKTDVNNVIDNTLALLGRQAMFQNVHTTRRLQEALPPVFIDPSQLQSALMNVIMNAVDAMEGKGVITLETTFDEASAQVLISICDTGRGIPDKIKPLIFEPFFTTKEPGEGTGLGLAIVYGVVKGAGGIISVDSSPSGTAFTMRLPSMQEDVGGGEARTAASDGA